MCVVFVCLLELVLQRGNEDTTHGRPLRYKEVGVARRVLFHARCLGDSTCFRVDTGSRRSTLLPGCCTRCLVTDLPADDGVHKPQRKPLSHYNPHWGTGLKT